MTLQLVYVGTYAYAHNMQQLCMCVCIHTCVYTYVHELTRPYAGTYAYKTLNNHQDIHDAYISLNMGLFTTKINKCRTM